MLTINHYYLSLFAELLHNQAFAYCEFSQVSRKLIEQAIRIFGMHACRYVTIGFLCFH